MIILWARMIYSASQHTLPQSNVITASVLSCELFTICCLHLARRPLFVATGFEKLGLPLEFDQIETICQWTFCFIETFMFSSMLPWIAETSMLLSLLPCFMRTKGDIFVCFISVLLSLCLQGKLWRYAVLILFEFMIGMLSEVYFETNVKLKTKDETADEDIANTTTRLQVDKRKKKTFKGKKRRNRAN